MSGLITEADLFALLDDGVLEEEREEDQPPLVELSRKLSGQYVDVIAGFCREALVGPVSTHTREQVRASADALVRLARAADHAELLGLLERLQHLTAPVPVRRRGRFLDELQRWIVDLAAQLHPNDAARLRELVHLDLHDPPALMATLRGVRGIGPRRLRRLYLAGLTSVEVLRHADPAEVSQATGLPRRLATRVVAAARDHAEAQRLAKATRVEDAVTELVAASAELPEAQELLDRVHAALARALAHLTPILADLEHPK